MPLLELSPPVVPPISPPPGPAPPEEAPGDGEDQEQEEQREDEAEGMKSPVGVGPCGPPLGPDRHLSAHRQTVREADAVFVRADGRDRPHHEQPEQNDRNNSPIHEGSFPPKPIYIYYV